MKNNVDQARKAMHLLYKRIRNLNLPIEMSSPSAKNSTIYSELKFGFGRQFRKANLRVTVLSVMSYIRMASIMSENVTFPALKPSLIKHTHVLL